MDFLDDITLRTTEANQRMTAFAAKVEARASGWTATDRKQFDTLNETYTELRERRDELEEAGANAADLDRQRAPFDDVARGGGPTPDKSEHRAGQWLVAELRALTGAGVTGGGSFTPADAKRFFFEMLTAKSVGLRSGFKVITTERDSVIIPRLTADGASGWYSEGATFTQTDATADIVTATPSKLAAITTLSNEVIADSEPAILDVVGQSIIRSIALKFDAGAFVGTGTAPEIRGLKNTTGVQTVSMGTNGAAFTNLDSFADAIGVLETENAEATAIVMSPRDWKALSKIKEATTANNKPLLQESAGSGSQGVERRLYGVPVFLSSQLPTNEVQGTSGAVASSAYVYEASQIVAVIRSETRLEKDSSRLFNSDQSELRAIMRADVVVPNPKAVCKIVGIIA